MKALDQVVAVPCFLIGVLVTGVFFAKLIKFKMHAAYWPYCNF